MLEGRPSDFLAPEAIANFRRGCAPSDVYKI